jgi:hypothetical protein
VTGPRPAADPVPHTRGGGEVRTAPALATTTHPPTHPAIAKLVTLAREVVGYRPPGAT